MGAGQGVIARSTTEVLSEVAVNVVQRNLQECATNTQQLQEINVEFVAGDVTLSGLNLRQQAAIDAECALQASRQNEIQNEISEVITQELEAQGQGFLSLFGRTRTEAQNTIRQFFTTNITQEDLQRSMTQISQTQRINIAGVSGNVVIENATLDQSARIVAEGIVNTEAYSGAINEISRRIDTTAEAEEENPLSFITDIFQGLTATTGLIIGGIILFIILLIFGPIILIVMSRRRGKKEGSAGKPSEILDVFPGKGSMPDWLL